MLPHVSRTYLCGLVMVLVAANASLATAQSVRRAGGGRYQGSQSEPVTSPYLNLIRPGADPGFNYYTLVQPQVQQQRTNQIQGSQIQGLGGQLRQQQQSGKQGPYAAARGIRATGRAASVQNYSHYYPRKGGSGGGGGGRTLSAGVSGGGGGIGVY